MSCTVLTENGRPLRVLRLRRFSSLAMDLTPAGATPSMPERASSKTNRTVSASGRLDLEPLLDLGATRLGRDRAIVEGRHPIDEALAGVLLHAAQRVLSVLI